MSSGWLDRKSGVRLRIAAGALMATTMLAAWAATRDMSEESPDRADATRATTAPSETTTTSDNGVASERPSDLIGGGYFKFDEVASDIGLRDLPEEAPSNIGAFVGGASVGDYDGDGKLDLFLTNFSISDRLFRATPEGNFVDVTADSGLIVRTGSPADGVGSAASVWADIDGDGALDLFVGGVGDQANQLYVNDGAGGFTEEAERRGVADMFTVTKSQPFAAHTVLGSAFADWDKDGDLDLMSAHWQPPLWTVADQTGPTSGNSICAKERPGDSLSGEALNYHERATSRFWENNGSGTFRDVTDKMGVDLRGVSSFTPVFADFDDDSWPDLFLTGDFCTSRLLRNTGDGFEDITVKSGLGTDENGMGSVVDDFNQDGHMDWFVSGIAPGVNGVGCVKARPEVGCSGNRLWFGDGLGGFEDVTDEFGVRDAGWAWGSAGEDFNNDGRRDLVVVGGYKDAGSGIDRDPSIAEASRFFEAGQSHIWRNSAASPWVESGLTSGAISPQHANALIPFDQNDDGLLDLLVANSDGAPSLLLNTTEGGGHWLKIVLRDETTSNTQAVGARVRIVAQKGAPEWIGEVRTGSGYQSSGPGALHIGLGDTSYVDSFEVRWPDSEVYEQYKVGSVDRLVFITRNE